MTSLRPMCLTRRAEQLRAAIGQGDALEAMHIVSQVPSRNGAIVVTVRAMIDMPQDQRDKFMAWLEQRSAKPR